MRISMVSTSALKPCTSCAVDVEVRNDHRCRERALSTVAAPATPALGALVVEDKGTDQGPAAQHKPACELEHVVRVPQRVAIVRGEGDEDG